MKKINLKNKISIEELYKKKKIIFIPANPKKKLESEYMYPFFETNIQPISFIISAKNTKNNYLNQKILEAYKEKVDIIIIYFDKEEDILPIHSFPKYPIFYKNVLYITPILIEQLNGFSSFYSDMISLWNDFTGRIYEKLGVILTEPNFQYLIINSDKTGIKDTRIGIYKDSNVLKIPEWMVKYIPQHEKGWMAIPNRLVIDYIFEEYTNEIQTIAELGIYLGFSTKYIASKKPNVQYYCFDRFDNLFLTNYQCSTITPVDTDFFFKYIRLETFHSNLSEYKNLVSIKGDNYLSIKWLKKNKIQPDLFYIDFIKNDKKLISFVEEIFSDFPNCLIVGDDAVYLNESLTYFSNHYHYLYFTNCYILSKNKHFKNTQKLMKKYQEYLIHSNQTNIDLLKTLDNDYKGNYIIKKIKSNHSIQEIVKLIEKLGVDLNHKNITFIADDGNLYHFICNYRFNNEKYSKQLYHLCNQYQKDEGRKNQLNLIPMDYLNYFIDFQ